MAFCFCPPLHENISFSSHFLYSLSSISAGLYVFSSSFICPILSFFDSFFDFFTLIFYFDSLVSLFPDCTFLFTYKKPFETFLLQRAYVTRYHLHLSLILFYNGNAPAHLTIRSDTLLQSYLHRSFLKEPFSLWILLSASSFLLLLFFPSIYFVKLKIIVQQKPFQCQEIFIIPAALFPTLLQPAMYPMENMRASYHPLPLNFFKMLS